MKILNKGFTLIELLVVIAIIGVLSSVILSGLNSARDRAKDAAIKEEVSEITNFLAMEFLDTGNYCNLQAPDAGFLDWITFDGETCESTFSGGAFMNQTRSLCNSILGKAGSGVIAGAGGHKIIASTVDPVLGTSICATHFSITVSLNNGRWYCSGTSGKGEYANINQPGCWNNP